MDFIDRFVSGKIAIRARSESERLEIIRRVKAANLGFQTMGGGRTLYVNETNGIIVSCGRTRTIPQDFTLVDTADIIDFPDMGEEDVVDSISSTSMWEPLYEYGSRRGGSTITYTTSDSDAISYTIRDGRNYTFATYSSSSSTGGV